MFKFFLEVLNFLLKLKQTKTKQLAGCDQTVGWFVKGGRSQQLLLWVILGHV